jgi:chromosome segregation ATPase
MPTKNVNGEASNLSSTNSTVENTINTKDKEKISASEEKSRQEMADLFATTSINQNNNLANVVDQQKKEAEANPQNMDLYFGGNASHNKIDKSMSSITKAKDNDNDKITEQLQHTVASITHEITDNVNQIKQLEDKLNELSKLLSTVNKNIGAIDSKVLGLTESVDSLTQDVSNVKKVVADEDIDLTANANKPENEAVLTYKAPGYSIHAIIPGRAWLKSSSGQIITVAEGDTVGDYGTVAVIDAANNIVRTSSGVSFR